MMRDVDLRLAGPAAGCWAVVALALFVPVTAVLAVTFALAATGMIAWLALRHRRSAVAATILALCGVGAASGAVCALRIAAVDGSAIRHTHGKPVVTLEVAGDPMIGGQQSFARLPVRVVGIGGAPTRPVDAQLLLRTSQLPETVPGQRISVRVRVKPPLPSASDRLIAARLSAVDEPAVVSAGPVWHRWAGSVRQRLRGLAARALPPRAAGLFPGLVLGDTGDLDPELRENFRAAGLSHLVAVSGANFGIVCGAVVLAVRVAGASTRLTVALGLLAMLGFVILVRPTDSVLRAAVMGGVGLAGVLAARRAQALPALGAAIVGILLFWPQMAVALGFVLSVAATLGLVLWASPLRRGLHRRGLPDALAVLLAMTLAAQILTTPIVIAISDRLSLVSLPANLLVAPVVGVIALLGTAAALIGAIGPVDGPAALIAEFLIRATTPEMWWLLTCADGLGGRSWAAPTVPGWQAALVLTLVGAFGWAAWRARRRRAGETGAGIVVRPWHHGGRE